MHDINKIRKETDLFCDGLKKRGLEVDIEKILKIDSNLRESISEIQSFQEQRNQISKDAGKAKSEGNETEFLKLNKESQEVKDSISKIEESKLETEKKLKDILSSLPNIPSNDLPVGDDESFNVEIKKKES